MAFRCLAIWIVATLGFFVAPTVQAADCVAVRDDYDKWGRNSVSLTLIPADCGPLKIVDRRRDDSRLKVNVYAIYPVFDPARDDAERRYNEWVGRRPGKMNFAGAIELSRADVADTMEGTLYRSPRLLSARIGGWICCGAHGVSWADSLNIDSRTGRAVQLTDLVEVAAVADFCWKEFSQLDGPTEKQGEAFARTYPRERFAELLRRVTWSVNGQGLVLDFDYLLGYVGAEFICMIRTADLPRFAKPGVAVPF